MIPLALQLLSREVHQFFAGVDIVGKVAIGLDVERVGEALFQQIAHIMAHTHHQEGMPHGDSVVSNLAYHVDRTLVAGFHLPRTVALGLWFGHGHHVSQVAVIVETEDEIVVYDGELCVIKIFPTDEIGK